LLCEIVNHQDTGAACVHQVNGSILFCQTAYHRVHSFDMIRIGPVYAQLADKSHKISFQIGLWDLTKNYFRFCRLSFDHLGVVQVTLNHFDSRVLSNYFGSLFVISDQGRNLEFWMCLGKGVQGITTNIARRSSSRTS
jgi:hypothetical protein